MIAQKIFQQIFEWWAALAAYFLSVSRMADKESSKETFVQSVINKGVKIYLYVATFLYLCKVVY